jgi:hypothetical protein
MLQHHMGTRHATSMHLTVLLHVCVPAAPQLHGADHHADHRVLLQVVRDVRGRVQARSCL